MESISEQKYKELQRIIDESNNIVFFGGAGVSTESGIPDFRSVDGLYNQKWDYPPETIISHTFFVRKTAEFYRFYRAKILLDNIEPNKAHKKLAELEKAGKLKAVITQNIDGLHQAAGSKTVYELHGSILRNYCTKCNKFYDADYIKNYIDKAAKAVKLSPEKYDSPEARKKWPEECIPKCDCPTCRGLVKPDVVLYEEGLNDATVREAINAIAKADCLIIGGTSLVVYPAASFINYFQGKYLVLINKSSTPVDGRANLVINDSIGSVLDSIKVK
ncbi:MAG: NAD-dependent deacylase [Treponemataceae bacterium]|nr:NAD-dependent deacylase [Treponemataceae bacterium]